MPRRQARIPYVGAAALMEELIPDPSEDAVVRQRLEQENKQLKEELKHLQAALEIAGRVCCSPTSRASMVPI
jgi:hypothetical protein